MSDTTFRPHGAHLIAGNWVMGGDTFQSSPSTGPAFSFSQGTPTDVGQACDAAEDAFWSFGDLPRHERAAFLECIADEIEARGAQITEIGMAESGLPEARLIGERGRTTGQLRVFAELIKKDDFLDKRHDPALPDRQPLPRPDIKLTQRPLGPVAVFGASNFPLAFSTAGGDTAAALAAGCPVVVKAHPAHPGTCEIVAEAVLAALKSCDVHPGTFSMIQGNGFEAGQALVQHPLIQAVGFTGSLKGGRALFDLCAARPTPIPFFGELGSTNPMFLLPRAVENRGADIAKGWAASLTMGAGQFCTNPGLAIIQKGPEADALIRSASEALKGTGPQTMLTDGIAAAYLAGASEIAATSGVETLVRTAPEGRNATPNLFATDTATWLAKPELAEEVFGPLAIIVLADDLEDMRAIALNLQGQLTATLHMDAGDTEAAKSLMPILERKAGRVLANGFPTGVEVADAMVHGGPYPASTNFGATSVGTMAIRRFLRPVSYQNMPDALLPQDLA